MNDLRERYLRLYTGAIADILDQRGYRHQVLPHFVTPFTTANRVAGFAFTVQGYPCANPDSNGLEACLQVLDSLTPGSVCVMACGGSNDCAHWGELMSTAASQRGCVGTVIDGGVRDLQFVDAMKYPVFACFRNAATFTGRWKVQEHQVPIRIGNTVIRPGDFVFGDVDGVVIVPGGLTLDVLAAADDVFQREKSLREDLRRGVSVKEAYARHGAL